MPAVVIADILPSPQAALSVRLRRLRTGQYAGSYPRRSLACAACAFAVQCGEFQR